MISFDNFMAIMEAGINYRKGYLAARKEVQEKCMDSLLALRKLIRDPRNKKSVYETLDKIDAIMEIINEDVSSVKLPREYEIPHLKNLHSLSGRKKR